MLCLITTSCGCMVRCLHSSKRMTFVFLGSVCRSLSTRYQTSIEHPAKSTLVPVGAAEVALEDAVTGGVDVVVETGVGAAAIIGVTTVGTSLLEVAADGAADTEAEEDSEVVCAASVSS
jgi:hypothetical protein